MATDDREIDRKAEPPTPDPDGDDVRPDFDHFDGFEQASRRWLGRLAGMWHVPRPDVSVVGAVTAALYAFVAIGALSVAYGSTSLAAAHGGVYVALIVAGVFAFAYGYVGLRFVSTVTRSEP